MDVFECDNLVIGSGPGGAITAFILAKAGREVLVIEEGRDESGRFATYSLNEMDRYRHGGLSVSRGSPRVFYLEGSCLGGASEINAGLYQRPLDDVLDQWQKDYAIQNFGSHALGPFFDMNEKDLQIDQPASSNGPGARVIERGAQNLNWKAAALARLWDNDQRRSMSRNFIPQARASGARFLLETKALKIHFRSQRAYEVIAVHTTSRKNCRIRCNHVFACGGAVQTPFLLRNSGLKKNVGERLRIHLFARLLACFESQASDPKEGVPAMQVSEFKPQLTLGGSFTNAAFLASWLAGRRDFTSLMQDPRRMGIFYASCIAQAPGKVRKGLFSREAALSMKVGQEDLCSLGQGLYRLSQLLFAAGARKILSLKNGSEDYESLKEMGPLQEHILDGGVDLSTMHLFASCPMGEDLSHCAVDSFGRVHGTKNVYVNDASMLSDAPGTNPQALIMALARRNALHWAKP